MTVDEQRLALAKFFKWDPDKYTDGFAHGEWKGRFNGDFKPWLSPPYSLWPKIPNYPEDLNIMHLVKIELLTTPELHRRYDMVITEIQGCRGRAHMATCEQECEAVMRLFNLWVCDSIDIESDPVENPVKLIEDDTQNE
jgi:hypothetical protein